MNSESCVGVSVTDSHQSPKLPLDYDLTCWYLNRRRVLELVGLEGLAVSGLTGQEALRAEYVALKNALIEWLNAASPPTLGQLMIRGKLHQHALFTHYSNYFGKGLPNIRRLLDKGRTDVPMAELYSKLDEVKPGCRLSFRFHHEHLVSNSAWVELSKQHQLFALGLVTKVSDTVIEAIPWVIASPLPHLLFDPATSKGRRWVNRLQVFIDEIDTFDRIRNVNYRLVKSDLEQLRAIPEQQIKQAFAEVIGEPTITKDWGGERSDLFSDRLLLDGKRIATALMFKGPAKFAPLTSASLGKNGDQIDRLFSEPADLLVLQHCHEITPAVRGQMRAYAQQIGRLKLFCLIDGYDTIRLLRGYKKCGL
jgi:hypothetical protein